MSRPSPYFENGWIFVSVLLLLALGMIITGYYYHAHQARQIRLGVESELFAIADLKVGEISDWRSERLRDIGFIFDNSFFSESLIRFMRNPSDSVLKRSIQTWMASLYRHYDYGCIFLLDAAGRVRVAECKEAEPVGDNEQRLAREAMQTQRTSFSDMCQNPQTGTAYLDLAMPILSRRGNSQASMGCLLLRVDLADYLYPLILSWPGTGRTGETFLVRREGEHALFLSEARYREKAALSLRFPLTARQMPEVMAAGGQEGIVEGIDYRGVPVLAALRRVPNSDWFLIAKKDLEEINAPMRQQGRMVALLVAALLLAASAGIGLLWRHLRIRACCRQEEALRENEKKYRELADFLPQIVFEIDTEGNITFTNRRSSELFGYSREELEGGLTVYQMLIPEDRERARNNILRIMQGEKRDGNEYTAVRKDGSTFPIMVHSSPIMHDGKARGLRGVIVDVTDFKRGTERMTAINEGLLQLGVDPIENINLLTALCGRILQADCALYNRLEKGLLCSLGQWNAPPDYQATDKPAGHICYDVIKQGGSVLVRDLLHSPYAQTDANVSRYQLQTYVGQAVTFAGKAVGSLCAVFGRDYVPSEDDKRVLSLLASAVGVEEERRQAQALQSALYRIAETAATAASLPDLYASLHRIVGELMFAKNFYIATFDADSGLLSFPYFVDEYDPPPSPRTLGKGLTEYVLRTGQSLLCDETTFAELSRQGEIELIGAPSIDWLGVPLQIGNKTFGVLVVQSYSEDIRFSEREKHLLTFVSQHIANGLERKRAEKETLEWRQRYDLTVSASGQIVYDYDVRTGAIFWSGSIEKVLGYALAEMNGGIQQWIDLIHPQDRDEAVRLLEIAEREVAPYDVEYRYRHKNGQYVWIHDRGFFIIDAMQKATRMLGMMQDITKRKQVEEDLKASEEKYRQVVENANEAILVAQDGLLKFLNPQAVELAGYSIAELLDQPFLFLIHPEDRDLVIERHKKRLSGEKVEEVYPFRITAKDGAVKWVEIRATLIDWQGKPATLNFLTDITERRRADEALQASELKFRRLAETTAAAIFIYQGDKFQYINPVGRILSGYSEEELLSLKFWEVVHPDFRDLIKERGLARQQGAALPSRYEFKIITKSGEERWVDFTAGLIEYEGRPAALGTAYDITEQKRAEQALRKSEEQYRTLIENQGEGILIADPEERILFINPAGVQIFGAPYERLIGRSLAEFTNPEQFAKIKQQTEKRRQGEKSTYEFTILRPDGEKRIVLVTATPQYDEQGQFIGAFGVFRDITERKRAEEALRQSEENYRRLVEVSPFAIYVHLDGKIVFANQASAKLLGAGDASKLIGLPAVSFVHADSRDLVLHRMQQMREGKEVPAVEEKFVRLDGEVIDVITAATSFTYQGRRAVQVVISDITELKRADKENRMLAQAIRSTVECVSITDSADNILYVNPAFLKTYGYEEGELIGKNISMVRSPNNPPELLREILPQTLAGGWQGELLNRRKDGSEFPLSLSTSVVRDEKGQPIALIGVAQDITERKQAEEQTLLQSTAMESAANGIVIADNNGNIIWVNPAFTSLTGYSAAEVVGRNPRVLKSGMQDESFYRNMWETILSGQVWRSELVNRRKDGSTYTEEMTITPVKNKQGAITHFIAIKEDVTERKQAEEQIKASLREKEVLLKEIHHRVKNNMQIISSLLNLQSVQIKDEQALSLFRESQNRVKSMALIHEKLYQSRDLAQIDFAEYVHNLTSHLFRSYGAIARNVTLNVGIHDVYFDVNTAVPCGLIVNELVSNSLKHAFPDGRVGTISVSVTADQEAAVSREGQAIYTLTVSDNGVGTPKDFDFRHTESLGMQLVNTLTEQLGGSVELESTGGTAFKITFAVSI